ncbi:DUF2335 domain-containing protein [Pendulispora albinea]|uniref:DUF2335 domain-containing protein n=1 Tax=Pendulispora albinea TaxID=2741071 RepID=A0ABZ2LXV7_9BACT
MLADYERAIAGSGERILRTFEAEAAHRHAIERAEMATVTEGVRAKYQLQGWGMACGFIVAMSGIGGSIYLIATGHDAAGATVFSVDLGGMVAAFIYGRRSSAAPAASQPNVERAEESTRSSRRPSQ